MKISSCIAIGIAAGFIIGEFYPSDVARGLASVGAVFSRPFSEFRNELALRYSCYGAVVGLVVGMIAQRQK